MHGRRDTDLCSVSAGPGRPDTVYRCVVTHGWESGTAWSAVSCRLQGHRPAVTGAGNKLVALGLDSQPAALRMVIQVAAGWQDLDFMTMQLLYG